MQGLGIEFLQKHTSAHLLLKVIEFNVPHSEPLRQNAIAGLRVIRSCPLETADGLGPACGITWRCMHF